MDFKLPSLGEGADSGTVVNVFIKEGDAIRKGQTILELENEKAVASIPATADGTVTKVEVKIGDKISVGQRILSFSASGGEVREESEKLTQDAAAAPAAISNKPIPTGAAREQAAAPEREEIEPGRFIPAAAPSIRKLAHELGVDLRRVRGSERGGRVVMADLRAYIQQLEKLAARATEKPPLASATKPAAEPIDFSKWGEITRTPLSPLRQVIRRRMAESWTSVPRVTQFDDADVTALQELRKKPALDGERMGARLTLTAFIVKATVRTLQKHPILNSSLDEAAEEIVLKRYFHIGIAVETETGLIVPVLRNADRKSLLEIAKDLEELAQKARDRTVAADELKGGTFTISNQGSIGGAHFTPIINRPEVAVLGLGRSAWKPVVRGSQIVSRLMLPLALSYDHRVIDGGSAARFIVDLVQALEDFKEDPITV